jgi:hypothetical protein
VTASVERQYPIQGVCARCLRERDDLFWHDEDQATYCADVFRCEARYEMQGDREEKGLPYRRMTTLPGSGVGPGGSPCESSEGGAT